MTKVVLDTNLYIDWFNTGRHEDLFLSPGLCRYLSGVVLLELQAGARTRAAQKALEQVNKPYDLRGRLISPSPASWRLAGHVLQRLQNDGREIRSAALVNDVLLALSARQIGARLYTRNAKDFEAIARRVSFSLTILD